MSKDRTAITSEYELLRGLLERYEDPIASLQQQRKWNLSWHNIENLAQDQVIIRIRQGSRTDTYRGLHLRTDKDSQSDFTYAPSVQINNETLHAAWKAAAVLHDLAWEVPKSFADEVPSRSVAVEEPVGGRVDDTTNNDILQWPSDQLASAIMQPAAETDMPRLRELILIAEDTGFTVGQSKRLALWLLSFAEKYRDSNDPQNEAAIWSAIRTGASMLRPQAANLLLPLLNPGHSIETSLVTVKMLGRIFEAQPPAEVDEYPNLVNETLQIAESLLNRYAITVSQSAAMAQLAIYALAAMASSETQRVVETIQQLGVTWFTQQMLRELRELRTNWLSHPVPVADPSLQLLDRMILTLE